MDSRTGQQTAATIAFSVSYEGENPSIVQQIANVLASLYLEENIRVVGQQTESTSKFLEEEMKAVQTELAELEKKIASYKQSHNFVLPELYQLNRQILDRTEEEIDQMNDQLRTLRDKETYMRSQLSGISPISVTQDKARLNELRVKLAALRAQYSDAFPDVIKTQEEIATLERRLSAKGSSEVVAQKPDNPAYVSLSADLAAIQSAIQSVNRQIANLVKKRDDYRWRVERAPNVEEGYKNLMVVRDNTKAKYDDLTRKFMEARVASGLEKGQMGERFSLIDPATLPEKPVKPPRLMIILIGFILGIGAGVGTASLQEASDHSARSSEDITKALRFPVLAEIPQIATVGEEQRRRRRLKRTIGAAVLIFVILVLVIHFFVMDLDVLWARIARRLDF
jgi:polysaccharide chain length determinant protein (PEP-CTERM system associated)